MVRLSRLTDYGIVLMTQLAREGESAVKTARDLADHTHVPVPTASKIMKGLARAGLVVAQRGRNGGYALVRAANHITIAQIVDALEGPVAFTDCTLPSA